jgi:hypothetical protein
MTTIPEASAKFGVTLQLPDQRVRPIVTVDARERRGLLAEVGYQFSLLLIV